ncbi:uncharacterized protein LOC127736218 [Mytilus californianus]|uniref:uncharacterized protein LOC127736218 n=1 Tax=Mytilus californianus TaxID=6549 RepID=UPI002247461A|nr:uncharacterized protein LOC127736218 [Mytilus californianus]
MNTQALVVVIVVMVTVACGLDYHSYNNYNNYPSTYGNSWDLLRSAGGRLRGGWNSGHGLSHRRYRRAALGYNMHNSYHSNNWGRTNQRLGRFDGWRRHNSGYSTWNGY